MELSGQFWLLSPSSLVERLEAKAFGVIVQKRQKLAGLLEVDRPSEWIGFV